MKRSKTAEQHLANVFQSCYAIIVKNVTRFCSIYEQVVRLQESNTIKKDMVSKAKSLFKDFESRDFKFIHCWRILKNYPNYMDPITTTPRLVL